MKKSTLHAVSKDLTSQDGRMLSAAHLAADAGHVEVENKTVGSWIMGFVVEKVFYKHRFGIVGNEFYVHVWKNGCSVIISLFRGPTPTTRAAATTADAWWFWQNCLTPCGAAKMLRVYGK